MVTRNDIIILIVSLTILTPLLIYPSYLSFNPFGARVSFYDWPFVVANIAFFCVFLIFVSYRRKVAWKTSSVYVAFIIALFAEMFGIPLTMFFFSAAIGQNNIFSLEFLLTLVLGRSLFYNIYMYFIYYISKVIIEIGIIVVIFGWKQIYYGARAGKLVTDGLYRYIRHPQYLGFMFATGGLLLQWPSIFTTILWPALVVMYVRLARKEDKEVEAEFGESFRKYKESVPAFWPRIRKKASHSSTVS